ncbi:MAG TPA: flavin reductase family protein [Steroidobacteraceae bacterium]|jgi:flavin reductase (DIM6/NTAB) family NADH-FMN oxidoreductase RutF
MNLELVGLFRQITLGVYVIGVAHERHQDAYTAASVMQVSYRPLMLAISIHPEHASYALLQAGRTFAVNVLAHDQIELARHFGTRSQSSPGVDKMKTHRWRPGKLGAPILPKALAYFDCAVQSETPAGDHRLIVGSVLDGAILNKSAIPLAYADTGDLDGSAALFPEKF